MISNLRNVVSGHGSFVLINNSHWGKLNTFLWSKRQFYLNFW